MDEKVMLRVVEHAKFVRKNQPAGYEMFFTALQGSQNYNMADDDSDVDTKTLLLPSFRDLVQAKSRVSSTLVLPNDEHADIKDTRDMFECFRKQNTNFVEILFTPYVITSPYLHHHYERLYNNREKIAHMNPFRFMMATSGHMQEKFVKFYPTSASLKAVEKMTKYGYDPKQLCHMLRLKEFLERFLVRGDDYEACLFTEQREDLMAIKRGSLPHEYAAQLREDTMAWLEEFIKEQKTKYYDVEDPEAAELLDSVLMDVFEDTYRPTK